ncbi:MAG: hypothetical protein AAGA93_25790 [Actinomycetota bacterium]
MSATDHRPNPPDPSGGATREIDLLADPPRPTGQPTGQAGAAETAVAPDRYRHIGERSQPANGGQLGYTYTIYRYYDADDRVLFVGRSERVRQRIIDDEVGHPRGLPLGHDDGPKPWWREAIRIELEHLPPGTTDAEARVEERRQIEAYLPRYNREFNRDVFDRSNLERAIDVAHFEVDVATAEHERHDGIVRPVDQITVETERAAERLRPAGASRLHYGTRRGPDDPGPVPGRPAAVESRRRRRRLSTGGEDGPGSIAGLIVILCLLAALTIAAVIVSLRVVL